MPYLCIALSMLSLAAPFAFGVFTAIGNDQLLMNMCIVVGLICSCLFAAFALVFAD